MSDERRNRTVMLGGLRMELLWCPPGEFLMGCSEDEEGDSEDAVMHPVTLTHGYWLGRYPVTQEEYEMLVPDAKLESHPSKFSGPRRPVERVTWLEAARWCQELTRQEREAGRIPEKYEYRLPTEAEWEYACRAGTTTALNSGKILTCADGECENLDEVAWYDRNSGRETHDVGGKRPNRWGFYDMHGNVEEWCMDWYKEYPPEAVIDPQGPSEGRYRVCRGGNMGGMAMGCSSSARKGGNIGNRRCYRGFRLALAPEMKVSFEATLTQAAQLPQLGMEELIQMRVELEERLGVLRPFEEAIGGDPNVPGSRNFTVDDPAVRMLWCPPGSFLMGSPSTEQGRSVDELQHQVTLTRGFWIGMYALTQDNYSQIAECIGIHTRPSTFTGLHRPVETVDYDSLCRWCRELTFLEFVSGRLPEGYEYRLPTEAQWEYACRAGTTGMFNCLPEGAEAGEQARQQFEQAGWYKYNSGYKTHVVGERQPNPWGLCDMHGNVREWCLDWYGDYPSEPVSDPCGPETGTQRVTRGGSYGDYSRHCRSAHRNPIEPCVYKANIGCRIVLGPVIRR